MGCPNIIIIKQLKYFSSNFIDIRIFVIVRKLLTEFSTQSWIGAKVRTLYQTDALINIWVVTCVANALFFKYLILIIFLKIKEFLVQCIEWE